MSTPETDDVTGILAPRCPRCGWEATHRPYTEANQDAVRDAARADVVEHKQVCRPEGER